MNDPSDQSQSRQGRGGALSPGRHTLERALQMLEVGIVVVDVDSDTVWLDAVARQLLGIVAADGEMPASTALARLAVEDRDLLLQEREAALTDPDLARYEAELRVVQDGDDVRWLRLLGYPVRDERGQVVQLQGFLRDVTEIRRTRDRLRAADERHRFLLEVEDAVRDLRDPVEIGDAMVTELGRELGAHDVVYTRVDDLEAQLVMQNTHGLDEALRREAWQEVDRRTLALVRTGSTLVIEDPATDERLDADGRAAFRSVGIGSLLVVPQLRGGQPVGLLSVADAEPRRWRNEELVLVTETVDRFWGAMEQATVQQDGEARLRSIIDTAADCIIVIDADGVIQMANPATIDVFGFAPHELFGRNVSVLMRQDDAARHDGYLERYRTTGKPSVLGTGREVLGRRRDGSSVPLELSVTDWRDSRGERLFTGILRDIGPRKRQEEELTRARKLETAGQLASGVAHDLNNLLTVIGGNLELAEEAAVDARSQELLGRALTAVRRGLTFNNRLLSLVQDRRRNVQSVALHVRLDEIRYMVQHLLGPDVRLDLRVAPDLWPVTVDPGELDSALLNLAGNAGDAMPRGGTLTIEARNASPESSGVAGLPAPGGEYVLLSVSDTGTGMSAEVLERAAEPFFTTKPAGHGTGLGLASVASFAHSSGGFITIDSVPSEGTTVTLLLPRGGEPEPSVAPTEPAGGLSARPRQRILVVDDDELVRETTVATLESLGYEVTSAADGSEAIACLEGDAGVALVLTDVVMPDGDGLDLARWIRANRPDTPVVLCSGYNSKRAELEHHLAVPFLAKPYTRTELKNLLASQLSD